MINFIRRLLSPVLPTVVAPLSPPHDPMDWRRSATSKAWHTDTYCSNCKSWTDHSDRMSGICHNCGSKKGVRNYRSSREIWNGTKWVIQHKYGDGPTDYDIVEG
jgi:hypothetical protein